MTECTEPEHGIAVSAPRLRSGAVRGKQSTAASRIQRARAARVNLQLSEDSFEVRDARRVHGKLAQVEKTVLASAGTRHSIVQ